MCPETKKKIKAHLKYVNHRNPPNKRSVYASYKGYLIIVNIVLLFIVMILRIFMIFNFYCGKK